MLAVGREGHGPSARGLGHSCNLSAGRVGLEEVHLSLTCSLEINASRSPVEEIGLLIKVVGDGFQGTTLGWHDRETAVGVVVKLLSHRRAEDNRFAVRRPLGVVVRAGLADDLLDGTI